MSRFINQSEIANFSENAARNEVIREDGVVTVYSGTPDIKDPAHADEGDWTISKTVITTDGTTSVETQWARGQWNNRKTLTYKYL